MAIYKLDLRKGLTGRFINGAYEQDLTEGASSLRVTFKPDTSAIGVGKGTFSSGSNDLLEGMTYLHYNGDAWMLEFDSKVDAKVTIAYSATEDVWSKEMGLKTVSKTFNATSFPFQYGYAGDNTYFDIFLLIIDVRE